MTDVRPGPGYRAGPPAADEPLWQRVVPEFRGQVMAVERVEKLLANVARALDGAGIEYAVIGGNAVAAWVSTVDEGAVRATKDVDVLVRPEDISAIDEALRPLNLMRVEVLGVHMYVDRETPNPRLGVHLVFANQKIRPEYRYPAPDPKSSARLGAGFRIMDLAELIRMKLQAFRRIDQVHIEDLLRIGLIDAKLAGRLPEDLRQRLREVRDTMEWHAPPPVF